MNEKITQVKCNKCGHILISGTNGAGFFASGNITIKCIKCGNTHKNEGSDNSGKISFQA